MANAKAFLGINSARCSSCGVPLELLTFGLPVGSLCPEWLSAAVTSATGFVRSRDLPIKGWHWKVLPNVVLNCLPISRGDDAKPGVRGVFDPENCSPTLSGVPSGEQDTRQSG